MPDRQRSMRRVSEAALRAQRGSEDFPIRPLSPPPHCPKPTREEREKALLKQRKEAFTRYDADDIDSPFDIKPTAPAFLDDAARLHGDIRVEQKQARRAAALSYSASLQHRRDAATQRNAERWSRILEQEEQEQRRLQQLQLSPTKALKNAPSMPINMLTLAYAETEGGVRLQHGDAVVRWRAAVRSFELDRKGNSEWNPVTNQRREMMPEPHRPQKPQWEEKTEQH